MARMDNFIKELLGLPSLVRESEVVLNFFGALNGQQGTIIRSSEDEKLKNVNKVAEILSGRDPLRKLPEKSSIAKQKTRYSANGIAEDLPVFIGETRDQLYRKLRQNKRHTSEDIPVTTSKTRATSLDNGILDRTDAATPRPGLKMRSFSAGVGLDNLLNEKEQLKESKPDDEPSKQRSGGDESLSVQSESSATDSEYSDEVEETLLKLEKKSSPQFGARQSNGRGSPTRKKHVVLRSFFAEESGEVSLEEGEEVDVLQKGSSGWWYVKNDFCEGWAPSAFLAPGRSRSISPETLDQQEISDNQDEHWQIKENLDSWPKQKRDDLKRLVPQGKEKSPGRNVAKVAAPTITSEMNRRAKLLTVEGIQKRKNPDKNYVYILKVVWSDGNINIIYRTCSDFFFLQESLKKEFPSAFGKEILALKGRKFSENCQFCFRDGTCKRQKFMNQFCHELINAPDNISKSQVVMDFCRSRASDVHPHGE
ncbi:SH3 and PX domain-containing protein 2A-like [Orbicella faveolata]|uniref:SH3 and PX domain-containing protein 2A-like n=1 Tax=Orbicella faveolata TaxID=48498 RepID=UPI0009E23313|nr:SH3 and PX domain-containing protein 2A-like [Orbicella faveolata]